MYILGTLDLKSTSFFGRYYYYSTENNQPAYKKKCFHDQMLVIMESI